MLTYAVLLLGLMRLAHGQDLCAALLSPGISCVPSSTASVALQLLGYLRYGPERVLSKTADGRVTTAAQFIGFNGCVDTVTSDGLCRNNVFQSAPTGCTGTCGLCFQWVVGSTVLLTSPTPGVIVSTVDGAVSQTCAVPAPVPAPTRPPSPGNAYQAALAKVPSAKTFLALATASKQLDQLGVATVLVPTDQAIAAFLKSSRLTAAQVLGDRALLLKLIQYHIIPRKAYTTGALRNGARLTTALQRRSLRVRKVGQVVTLVGDKSSARITRSYRAGKGRIVLVNAVLVPK